MGPLGVLGLSAVGGLFLGGITANQMKKEAEGFNKRIDAAQEMYGNQALGMQQQDYIDIAQQSQMQQDYANRAFMSTDKEQARTFGTMAIGSMDAYKGVRSARQSSIAKLVQQRAELELQRQDPNAAAMEGWMYGLGSGLSLGTNMASLFTKPTTPTTT